MFDSYFADFHIHIGADAGGDPVKITASRKLHFASIAREALHKKGLDIVGVIDCASPRVINDIEDLLAKGEMEELPGGGLRYKEDLVIILGSELESREKNGGQAHYLTYFPYLDNIREFSKVMEQYITNINLSSQSTGLFGQEIYRIVEATGGILIPAHAFTPHKSFYGNCFSTYKEVFTEQEWDNIPAIELGLSADTYLADYLSELAGKTFLSNSDAHSLGKIAREYNLLSLHKPNFDEIKLAFMGKAGRKVIKNFGMDPRLGKYHRSFCPDCEKSFPLQKSVLKCPLCGHESIVNGVKDRILEISDNDKSSSPAERPPYIHQVPLADVPGIGKKTLQKLLSELGTEMDILHSTDAEKLYEIVNKKIARGIIKARTGESEIETGGGGNYGKVVG